MTNKIGQCYIGGWAPQVTVYLETKLVLFCIVFFIDLSSLPLIEAVN